MKWRFILGLIAILGTLPAAHAQTSPRIAYVYPAGGRQGSSFQIKVGGQLLNGANIVHITGDGVHATITSFTKPLSQLEMNTLREKLKELMDRRAAAATRPATTRPFTDADAKMLLEIRDRLAVGNKKMTNPAMADTATVQVTLAADAAPGERELRIETPLGISNPLIFCVGQLPEFRESDVKTSAIPMEFLGPLEKEKRLAAAHLETTITLPAVANGRIMPGAADRYRFTARKGMRLVAVADAQKLIPYIADAVPGWFQATLALYDAKGTELAYNDDFRFNPDPVLFYEIPSDGDYVLEIKDSIYRGREDFVYRITVGELPFITGFFPLGGKAGVPTSVELTGWNLPSTRLTQNCSSPGIRPLSMRLGQQVSNTVPFAVDTLPECSEQEPNDKPGNAQPVSIPTIINGRIDKPGDTDVFCFEGHSGDTIVAEVQARRLGSPLDSLLLLTDASGKQLATNDDFIDKAAGLVIHQADSQISLTLPSSGTFYLHLRDTEGKGGPDCAYRLRISPPRPDFELRVTPSNLNVRGGSSVSLTVHAIRRDGFTGDIALSLIAPPAGFTLGGAQIPANQDHVKITLKAPPIPGESLLSLNLEGRATIQGQTATRRAIPADDREQAFIYHHLVPARELLVAIQARWMPKNEVKLLTATPVKVPSGGVCRIQIGVTTATFKSRELLAAGSVLFELGEPDGLAIQSTQPIPEGTQITLKCDPEKLKPGMKGNIIINSFMKRPVAAGSEKSKTPKRPIPLGTLPAIPFEVVAP